MLAAFCTERRNIEEKKKRKKRAERRKNLKAAGNSRAPIGCGGLTGMCHSAGAHRLCTLASVTWECSLSWDVASYDHVTLS